MKKPAALKLLVVIIILFHSIFIRAQAPVNWTKKQLMEPSVLVTDLNEGKNLPLIVCVGPGAVIPNSIDIGMVNSSDGLNKLKTKLSTLPKNSRIVIYCGCCPFEHCPDVRPAIDALKELNFTDYYVLNLPDNIRKNWIDKGYPVAK